MDHQQGVTIAITDYVGVARGIILLSSLVVVVVDTNEEELM